MTEALILQISPHRDEIAKLGSCRKPKADDSVLVKERRQGVAMVTRINKLLVANLTKTHRSTGVHIQKPALIYMTEGLCMPLPPLISVTIVHKPQNLRRVENLGLYGTHKGLFVL